MGRLFEGFEILCTGYDHMLEKSGDIIQGKTLYKGGHYSRKYGMYYVHDRLVYDHSIYFL